VAARRAPRFALEILFLSALAAALVFADLRAVEIVGLMLLGWVLVAIFEWGALRGLAHYGSGLPPRWFVPKISLPPPRPLEQVSSGYPAPETVGDAPTWIASPAMLADWPVAEIDSRLDESTEVHDVLEVELALAVAEKSREELAEGLIEPEVAAEASVEQQVESEPVSRAGAPVLTARHQIDPLDAPAPKSRRFGRRQEADRAYADVPARPEGTRSLPSRSRGDD
jgi:hypothetical protein